MDSSHDNKSASRRREALSALARQNGRPARRLAARLTAIYAAAAVSFLLAAGVLLAWLVPSRSLASPAALILGAAFVVVTAGALYLLALRYLVGLRASQERYRHLFENATEGLILFRVERDAGGAITDVVVEGVNAAQSARSLLTAARAVGMRLSRGDEAGDRMRAYFEAVCQAVEAGGTLRTDLYIPSEDATELVGIYAVEPGLWALTATDITEVRRAERASRHDERRIHQAYVDVISAVTGGKLILLTEQALGGELGTLLMEAKTIHHSIELTDARHEIARAIAARHPGWQASSSLLSPMSEALNNALKHAGGGTYQAFSRGGTLQVSVTDDGPGIDFHTLPRATLIPGYSTIESLGMGFTIMLHLCERVLLSTRPGRTQVVLEIPLEPQPAQARLQQTATRKHVAGETRDRVAP